jgi:imidazolonepropionase
MKADLVISNIGQLVTCASPGGPKRGAAMRDVGLIENASVAIAHATFAAVGERRQIESEWEAVEAIDAGGKVVCPGFVDAHTHIVWAGSRLNEFEEKIEGVDYLDILAAGGGILSTVEATRRASCDELVELGLRRLDKMLACGTTTAEVKTGYGLDTDTELKMLQVIEELDKRHAIDLVPTFLAAHAIPAEYKNNVNGYVDLIIREMLQRAWKWFVGSRFYRSVPFFCDVFCENKAFSLAQSKRILETARSLGFKLKAHTDEFTNLGGSAAAIALGATSIDHLDAISAKEVSQLAASDTVGLITPAVNFNFGSSHFADARKLIDEGCAVAMATDYNPGSAPCASLPMSMAIACRYQKLLPAEAFNAVTINAAFAIGLGERAGSIEVGKKADLVIADTNDHRDMVYEFGGGCDMRIIKAGKLIRQ